MQHGKNSIINAELNSKFHGMMLSALTTRAVGDWGLTNPNGCQFPHSPFAGRGA